MVRNTPKSTPVLTRPLDVLQLPLWSDDVRGLPNALARSALFGVGNRAQPRRFYRTHRAVQTLAGWTLSARGEELRQDDEDVFLQLVHMARERELDTPIDFTAHSVLRALQWGREVTSYDRLRVTIDRLQGVTLRLVNDEAAQRCFQGALVRKFVYEADDAAPIGNRGFRWRVWLEPEIVKLFGQNAYTRLGWEQRLSLGSPLAKFLHAYYSTHLNPFAVRCETMQALCGSTTARLGDFRKGLRAALSELVRVKFLDSWSIDKADLIHVVRARRSQGVTQLASIRDQQTDLALPS